MAQITPNLPAQIPNADPLAGLEDIVLPATIHQYPIAPGWWILLAIILILLIVGIKSYLHYKKINKAKKFAITSLKTTDHNIAKTITILKWACLQYFPRTAVANLSGESLKNFLTAQLADQAQEQFIKLSKDSWLVTYQLNGEQQRDENFTAAALLWLKNALPPKAEKNNKLIIKKEVNNG